MSQTLRPSAAIPITWARLQSNVLVVYRMKVDENGVAELHVYQRTRRMAL